MPVAVVEGEQRGDEGKGRVIDLLMPDYEWGARYNGGDNAGHTVCANNEVYKLHGLPSSIVHEHARSIIGNGTVINAANLLGEIATLRSQGVEISPDNLFISGGAHLTLPSHILADEIRESGAGAQGSTKSGIAQVYADKAARVGLRAEDINTDLNGLQRAVYERLRKVRRDAGHGTAYQAEDKETAGHYVDCASKLGPFITDTVLLLNRELRKDRPARVLAEGAQAFLLDIDQGMYPYVTSSSTTAGGVASGLGIPGKFIDRVVGVAKAIQSHVGGGPFVTEIHDPAMLQQLHGDMAAVDAEKGTTTGRVRRLGHLDLPQIRRSQLINGTDDLALTKLDWVPRYGESIPVCVAYERKGKILSVAPDSARKLQQSTPLYEFLPNWSSDIQKVRSFDALPSEAQQYVGFIEAQTGVRVSVIGVGPERDQVIKR